MKRLTGRYETTSAAGEEVNAFMPARLPPSNPPLELRQLSPQLKRAEASLSRLELAGEMIPSIEWFIYAFVRKEAVLSSQIEGTQATLDDLLAYEADARGADAVADDVVEVCNYLRASSFALAEIRRLDGLPISMRLLNETHRLLLQGARGANKQPGEVRRSQNWIGGTRPGNARFVPPPPHLLAPELSAFERYIHDDELPSLVRAGLLHVQFETLHPYLDGNGRIGRLLITLLLEHWHLLSRPLLYLSLFFKRHRDEYYRRLGAVRTRGDWEGWCSFFLEGIATVADEAVRTAQELFGLMGRDRRRVLSSPSATVMSLRLFELLPEHPVINVTNALSLLKTTRPTAGKAIAVLESAGVLLKTSGRKRNRTWRYSAYLDLLRVGMEEE